MKRMETHNEHPLRRCGCCHRLLPREEFSVTNRVKSWLDSYCKECRRASRTLRYMNRSLGTRAAAARPLITSEADPERRMALIRHACLVVRESVLRKRRRLAQEEALADGCTPDALSPEAWAGSIQFENQLKDTDLWHA